MDALNFFNEAWSGLEGTLKANLSLPLGDLKASLEFPNPSWAKVLSSCLYRVSQEKAHKPDISIRVFGREDLHLLPAFPSTSQQELQARHSGVWNNSQFQTVTGPNGIIFSDKIGSRSLVYYESPSLIPIWDLCAPFRTSLTFLLPTLGYQLVHGAALSYQDISFLLVGKGGSGKSSTALSALSPLSKLGFISEDYVLVEQKKLTAWPLFCSFKVDGLGMERMPWLKDFSLLGLSEQKHCCKIPQERLGLSSKLRYLIWPNRQSLHPLKPINQAKALLKLAPSTLSQNPGSGAKDLCALAQICRGLKAYELGLLHSPGPQELESILINLASHELVK